MDRPDGHYNLSPVRSVSSAVVEAPPGTIPIGTRITTIFSERGIILNNVAHPWYWTRLDNPYVPRFNPTGLHISTFKEIRNEHIHTS